jgi:spore germination cell wall hydrolase CwlJ-like protein
MTESKLFLSKFSTIMLIWLAMSSFIIANIAFQPFSRVFTVPFLPTYQDIRSATINIVFPTDPLVKPDILKNDLQCMAENIYYEAATQSYAGKIAVGQVVLNRTKASGFPDTVCKVIYEGSQSIHTTVAQFSWTVLPHKAIDKSSFYWSQSLLAAKELLTRKDMIDITEGAVSYHADYVNPDWSKSLQFVTQIDNHLFYRKKHTSPIYE